MIKRRRFVVWLLITLALGLVVLPALADTGLPSRDPPPQQDDDQGQDNDRGGPPGAYIELVAPGYSGAWSVVQWQDVNDDWHDVDGWRGSLNEHGSRRWWVAAKDFGTGPFRWVVGDSASPMAMSKPFYLPAVGAATLVVSLPPE